MSNNEKDESNVIDILQDQVSKQGVGIVSVKDGSVFLFDIAHLKRLIEKHKNQKHLSIFVKRPDSN